MVISKCVPLEISRKKFSQFLEPENYANVCLVGYEKIDDTTKKNVQLKYEDIESSIIRAVKADPEWGQGGNDSPDDSNKIERNTSIVISGQNSEYWNEEIQTNLIDLKWKQGFIEINAGGDYQEDYIMFSHPVIGSITHVVVDNTGLPITDSEESIEPISDSEFVLYYGTQTDSIEIFRVPANYRGVVQILHTEETDLIFYSSYSWVDISSKYVRDIFDEDAETNEPINVTPESNASSEYYINMDNQKSYVEFPTGDKEVYTFIFSNQEIGSSTYIVVDNTGDNYYGYPVTINYGKIMDDGDDSNGKEPDWIEEITTIENEKAIIEVFHSLSADIIVKITKV